MARWGTVAEMTSDLDRPTLEAALAGRGAYELFACDPALADTAAFCAAYGFAPEDAANTIVVVGKADPPRYGACVVLATHRLDVNHAVRARLGARRASFASADETRALTGQELGGVTAFGLPDGFRSGWIRRSWPVPDRAGRRQSALESPRATVDPAHAADVEVVDGLARPAAPPAAEPAAEEAVGGSS